MTQWLRIAWHVLMFRLGPQDLPGSKHWTTLAAIFYLLSGLVLLTVRGLSERALPMLAVDLLFALSFVYAVLYLRGRAARIWQSLQALWLCGALLHLAALPFAPPLAGPAESQGLMVDMAVVVSLALVFWSIGLMAHVMRHALDWRFGHGLMLAVVHAGLNILIHYQLFAPNV